MKSLCSDEGKNKAVVERRKRGLGSWGPYDLAHRLELGEMAEEIRAAIQ